MANKISFLLVDNDKNNLISLKKIIPKVIPFSVIYTAEDGIYALEFLKKNQVPSVIICHYDIEGISGLQFLQKVKTDNNLKDCYFIMILPQLLSKDDLAKIINSNVDAYINVPIVIEDLVVNIRSASNYIDRLLILREKDNEIENLNIYIKETTKQLRDIVIKIQKYRFKGKENFFEVVSKAALWIAKMIDEDLSEEFLSDLETAASMLYIGKLFLPDKNIEDPVMVGGFSKNETMEKVPSFTRELIEGVKGMENIAKILVHIYENYDGSGIPDKLKGWEIPLGSRILRAVADFEEQMAIGKKPMMKILEEMDLESKRIYDYRVVTLLDQYLAASKRDRSVDERPIEAQNLRPGNIISRSLVTRSGLKLVSPGTILKEDNISKIQAITATDPVIGYIWIRTR